MLLLDTNVLSEMMRPAPAREVARWIVEQPSELLFTGAVCQAEILAGIAVLPNGARRAGLLAAAQTMFAEDFQGRVLPFDGAAATAYGDAVAARRAAGRHAATIDLMLAAIALAHGAVMVTRNVADFEGVELTIINPWSG